MAKKKRKTKKKKEEEWAMKTPGFAWRVSLSIIVFFGWLVFLIIWLFFYAGNFNIYQNIAIFVVSVMTGLAILGAAWASWGIKYGCRTGKKQRKS
ncbi:MAG: hypothetical protein JSV92_04035 [archaeon]|nr:MAG: hypothetical protein JSV92_04035 [archaeon]